MANKIALTCVFRRPRFPLICSIHGDIVAGQSLRTFERLLARFDLSDYEQVDLVDANGESWVLLPDQMALAPAFSTKRWRKLDIVRLFNESRNAKANGLRYRESVLSNKRLDTIVNDLAALLSRSRGTRADKKRGRAI